MKRAVVLIGFLILLVLGSGCAHFGTYMKDRGNDLADCFTARVGLGFGLGARAQITNYFGASVGASVAEKKFGYFGREPVETEGGWVGVPVLQAGIVMTCLGARCSAPPPWVLLFFPFFTDLRFYEDEPVPAGLRFFGVDLGRLGMKARESPPPPFLRERFFIEVGASLGAVGFDVGFNPLEFFDFLLGWFTADITGDDEMSRPEPPRAPTRTLPKGRYTP